MSPRTLEHFRALDYPIELVKDREQGGFYATHPDLPGCAAQGETADEAVSNLADAFESWIEARLAEGLPIAEPVSDEPSGRFLVRSTPSVHRSLTRLAKQQGVSLNLLVNNVLSEYIGLAASRDQLTELAQAVTAQLGRFTEAAQEVSNRAYRTLHWPRTQSGRYVTQTWTQLADTGARELGHSVIQSSAQLTESSDAWVSLQAPVSKKELDA
jgi:antitoxin HicB